MSCHQSSDQEVHTGIFIAYALPWLKFHVSLSVSRAVRLSEERRIAAAAVAAAPTGVPPHVACGRWREAAYTVVIRGCPMQDL